MTAPDPSHDPATEGMEWPAHINANVLDQWEESARADLAANRPWSCHPSTLLAVLPFLRVAHKVRDAIPAEPLDVRGLGPNPFGVEDEDPAAAIAEAALREWWDDLTSEEQWEAFRIEKDNSDSMDSLADPASHIGCRFNHVHRWPDCYDEAYEPDTLDRLMALWQQPWSEAAFGEAQMLVGRLRRKPLNVERLARTGVKVWGWDLHRARQYAKDFAREYAALPDTIQPEREP